MIKIIGAHNYEMVLNISITKEIAVHHIHTQFHEVTIILKTDYLGRLFL